MGSDAIYIMEHMGGFDDDGLPNFLNNSKSLSGLVRRNSHKSVLQDVNNNSAHISEDNTDDFIHDQRRIEYSKQYSDKSKSLIKMLSEMSIKGVDEEGLTLLLIEAGILTVDDLAELSIDELFKIQYMRAEAASNIIMSAREDAGWFD